MIRARHGAPLLACLLLAAPPAGAASSRIARVELDPARTVVAFHLAATLHDVDGTFALASGTLAVAPQGGEAGGGAVVDATSGRSGNAARDRRLAEDILDSARFPQIRFRAERSDGRLEPDGTFRGLLRGVLTLRGDDHDVSVVVDGRVAGDRFTAHGRFAVPYVEWGLPDPSVLVLRVGKTVDIDVTTEGRITWAER